MFGSFFKAAPIGQSNRRFSETVSNDSYSYIYRKKKINSDTNIPIIFQVFSLQAVANIIDHFGKKKAGILQPDSENIRVMQNACDQNRNVLRIYFYSSLCMGDDKKSYGHKNGGVKKRQAPART